MTDFESIPTKFTVSSAVPPLLVVWNGLHVMPAVCETTTAVTGFGWCLPTNGHLRHDNPFSSNGPRIPNLAKR